MEQEKKDRMIELRNKAAQGGGLKALSEDEQKELQALKAENEVALLKAEKEENAPKVDTSETVTMPKSELRAILDRLQTVEKLTGQNAEELAIGKEVPVSQIKTEQWKQFPRWQKDSTEEWMFIVDQKWMGIKMDKELRHRVNFFEVTLMDRHGNIKTKSVNDHMFAEMWENHLSLKMTNRRVKEFQEQDSITPWLTNREYKIDSDPKSVTGVKVIEKGKVPNIKKTKKVRYTVHMPKNPGEDGHTFDVICDAKGMHLMTEAQKEEWDALT